MERYQDEVWTARVDFASAKAEVGRLVSDLDRIKEQSKEAEANQKDAVDRERDRDQRYQGTLEEDRRSQEDGERGEG